jgi:hypothetical protein
VVGAVGSLTDQLVALESSFHLRSTTHRSLETTTCP